jgi:hypothetical protein
MCCVANRAAKGDPCTVPGANVPGTLDADLVTCLQTLDEVVVTGTTQGSFVPLAPIPGLTDIQPANGGLATFLNNLYKYLIGLAAVLAVLEIIYGGLQYSAQDSISKKEDGKERIQQAILGLVLVLSPVLVFSIINPSILNLSLNLPPIKPMTAAGGGGTVPTLPATASGCRPTGGNHFQSVSCPTQAAATGYTCPSGTTGPVIPACPQKDQNGNCLSTTFQVYCTTTMNPNPYFYAPYSQSFNPFTGGAGSATITPRDKSALDTFRGKCSGDGGTLKYEYKETGGYVALLGFAITNGCPSDAGTLPYDATKYSAVVCFQNIVTCGPN